MPRQPKPYVKNGWFCTSLGGIQHQKLCPVEQGLKNADLALARLRVQRTDDGHGAIQPATTEEGRIPSIALAGPKNYLLGEVHDDFLDYKKAQYGENSTAYQDFVVRLKPLLDQYGNQPFSSLTDVDGLRYRYYLQKEKPWMKGKILVKGLRPPSVNSRLGAAKCLFNWACKPRRRLIYGLSINPWEEVDKLPERSRERVVTDKEFEHLLENCEDGNLSGGAQDFRETLIVMRHTTMRPGELRLLKWDYIQWENHRIK
jgi:integrase